MQYIFAVNIGTLSINQPKNFTILISHILPGGVNRVFSGSIFLKGLYLALFYICIIYFSHKLILRYEIETIVGPYQDFLAWLSCPSPLPCIHPKCPNDKSLSFVYLFTFYTWILLAMYAIGGITDFACSQTIPRTLCKHTKLQIPALWMNFICFFVHNVCNICNSLIYIFVTWKKKCH